MITKISVMNALNRKICGIEHYILRLYKELETCKENDKYYIEKDIDLAEIDLSALQKELEDVIRGRVFIVSDYRTRGYEDS